MKVGQLFEVKKGKKVEQINEKNDMKVERLIQIEDLRNNKNIKYCIRDTKAVFAKEEDIIIAWDGANAGTIGYGLNGVIGSTLAVLRPKQPLYTPYVGIFLQTKSSYLRERSRGATVPHIQKDILLDINIPFRPIEEQKRIAKVFGEAQTLINLQQQNIVKLDEFLRSYFIWKAGPKNSSYEDWQMVKVKDLANPQKGSMRTGPFGSDLKHSEFIEEPEIAVLGIDNAVSNVFEWGQRRYITHEKYEKLKRYTVKPGDVIITIMGTTGRSAVVPKDIPLAITTKHLATITVDEKKVVPEYLSYSIHSHPNLLTQIKQANKGAIMDGLNLKIIKELELRLPPLEIQKDFLRVYREVNNQKEKMKCASQLLNNNFQALLKRGFNGELNIKGTINN